MGAFSFLDRSHSVANPGFSRWLVPPAALSIHLAIGQVYAFSVFKKPLNYLVQVSTSGGGLKPLPGVDSPNPLDWKFTSLGWIFSVAIVVLGLSAAVFGKWLERAGPRKAMFTSAVCFASGFIVSALGVQLPSTLAHLPWLRRDWRHWSRPRIYFSGFDSDQVVPRPPGHGNGNGDHGVWRGRAHWFAAGH
jgi:MFS family permease